MIDEGSPSTRKRSVAAPAAAWFAGLLLIVLAMGAGGAALAHRSGGAGRGATTGAYGAPTPVVEVQLSEFRVLVSQFASAPAGNVTFAVKNAGSIDHEMLVFKSDTPPTELPIVDGGDPPVPVKARADKVDEAPSVGETGAPDVGPGETRTFTVKGMSPGKYILLCNRPKHYGMGMRVAFTVH